ncbi:MAG TPA: DnaJ domain-containing protein [Usitatibacter sp.]|nr:DnaJ domain-containing protein [Usitatibacter sp.]
MPYGHKSTLYDALGLTRDAKQSDILRTYRRLSAELRSEASAPDPRREALIHEAYEVLSDPQRRAAYDKSLRDGKFFGETRAPGAPLKWGALALVVVLGGALAYYFMAARRPAMSPLTMSREELQAAVSVAVGRVNRVEMSGARSAQGVAVAIEEGVMMAPCAGIGPGVQILVRIPPRDIPAQVRAADDPSGLCRLAVSGGASWPLRMASVIPRVGDTVHVAMLGSLGEVIIASGEVTKLEGGRILAVSAKADTPIDGTPLLDHQGRIIAVALGGRFTLLPASWITGSARNR